MMPPTPTSSASSCAANGSSLSASAAIDSLAMGLLDKIKGLLGGNKKAVTDAVDKVADVVESKTPDSIDDKVEMAAEKVKDVIENVTDEK